MNIKKSFLYLLACTLLGAGGCSDDDESTTFKELKVFSMTPNEGVAGDEVTRIQHYTIRKHRYIEW